MGLLRGKKEETTKGRYQRKTIRMRNQTQGYSYQLVLGVDKEEVEGREKEETDAKLSRATGPSRYRRSYENGSPVRSQ